MKPTFIIAVAAIASSSLAQTPPKFEYSADWSFGDKSISSLKFDLYEAPKPFLGARFTFGPALVTNLSDGSVGGGIKGSLLWSKKTDFGITPYAGVSGWIFSGGNQKLSGNVGLTFGVRFDLGGE